MTLARKLIQRIMRRIRQKCSTLEHFQGCLLLRSIKFIDFKCPK